VEQPTGCKKAAANRRCTELNRAAKREPDRAKPDAKREPDPKKESPIMNTRIHQCIRAVVAGLLAAWSLGLTVAAAAPVGASSQLDARDFVSLGASPFSASGTYSFDTSKDNPAPTLSGPGIATPIAGVFYSPSGGTVPRDEVAVFTFDSVSIPANVLIGHAANGNSRPLALLSRSTTTIDGTIIVSGSNGGRRVESAGNGGNAGPGGGGGTPAGFQVPPGSGGLGLAGGNGGDSTSPGRGGSVAAGGGGDPIGGGGAFGGNGGTARGVGGTAYGNLGLTLQGGSGGAGGSVIGGGGGAGALELGAGTSITITGSGVAIAADGGSSPTGLGGGNGGGGAGGGILIHAPTVSVSTTVLLSARGGGPERMAAEAEAGGCSF
jgi:hypothetical protein